MTIFYFIFFLFSSLFLQFFSKILTIAIIARFLFNKQHFHKPHKAKIGNFHKVALTLPNVVKFDVENVNVVSTLSIVAHNKVERDNVILMLFYVANSSVDINKVISELI